MKTRILTSTMALRAGATALLLISLPARAEVQTITVPNGDFETAGNDGSVGGVFPGLFGSSFSAVPLNGGPWEARSWGLLNLLLAPQVTIASNGAANGDCRISSLAAINIFGAIFNSRAAVSQTLSVEAQPWAVYTLEADVDCGSLLSAAVLSQNGVGVALTVNGGTVATSLTSAAPLLTVSLLSGTSYRVTLRYATADAVPAGNIGIRLFAGEGVSLVSASILSSATFDNVRLTIDRLEA